MANFFAIQVILGNITLEKIPEKYKKEVIEILKSYE